MVQWLGLSAFIAGVWIFSPWSGNYYPNKLHGVASKRKKYCTSCYLRAYYMLDACTTFVLYKIAHLSFCSNPDLHISKLKL